MLRFVFLSATHLGALAVGFALGVYFLPILTAPPAPDAAALQAEAAGAEYTAEFTRDLAGSDFLHWGEGTVSVSSDMIVHEGKLAPGPDYKVYLVKDFVEDEAGFEAIKSEAVLVGDVKTFEGFLLNVPETVDVAEFSTILVWCESFGEFITAAKYQ